MPIPISSKLLREFTLCPNFRALPVEHINRNQNQEPHTAEQRTRPLEMILASHVLVHWRGVHGRDTSKEVSRKAITTRCRCRVRSIRRNHVVYRRHVDCIIRHCDQTGKDTRRDPGDWRAGWCPREAEETDWFERCDEEEEEEEETALGETARCAAFNMYLDLFTLNSSWFHAYVALSCMLKIQDSYGIEVSSVDVVWPVLLIPLYKPKDPKIITWHYNSDYF